jgi:hypothetical protein
MNVRVGKFPFRANGRALANEDAEGVVKFVADAKTDKILGAHILQHAASELIAEPTSVIEFGGSSEDLGPDLPFASNSERSGKGSGSCRGETCATYRESLAPRIAPHGVACAFRRNSFLEKSAIANTRDACATRRTAAA